jgi:signal transduction histidine kinase
MTQAQGETPLELLLEANRLLSSKLDLGELLRTVIELSARVVGAESASLLLLDEKTNELYFDVALGLGDKASSLRLPLGQGIAGAVAASRQAEIINDVRRDRRWSPKMDEQSGFVTRSILALPMERQGRLFGVVEAINKREGGFTQADVRALAAFGSQAAIAIDNARLFSSLKDEKHKLDTVFTQMTDGAILATAKGEILLSNDAAGKFFGVGTGLTSLPAALKGMTVSPSLGEIMRANQPVSEFTVTRELPKKLVLHGRAITVAQGWLCLFRDVTDEDRKEGLKRTFLSLISHKLKTPLAAVIGFADLLAMDAQGTQKKAADTIATQGRKLSVLVDKLLRFTTLEGGKELELKATSVDDVVASALKSLDGYLKESGGRVEHVSCGLTVLGNSEHLSDVIKNLVENAVKFDTKPEKRVKVWAERRENRVETHVQDSGPGIPPEDQDRIFSQFHQVEADFTGQVDGWGLGLPFCRKVVELHGGQIRLLSKLGEGTTFTISLPAA